MLLHTVCTTLMQYVIKQPIKPIAIMVYMLNKNQVQQIQLKKELTCILIIVITLDYTFSRYNVFIRPVIL